MHSGEKSRNRSCNSWPHFFLTSYNPIINSFQMQKILYLPCCEPGSESNFQPVHWTYGPGNFITHKTIRDQKSSRTLDLVNITSTSTFSRYACICNTEFAARYPFCVNSTSVVFFSGWSIYAYVLNNIIIIFNTQPKFNKRWPLLELLAWSAAPWVSSRASPSSVASRSFTLLLSSFSGR